MSGLRPDHLVRDPADFLERVRASDGDFSRFPEYKNCYAGPVHELVSLVGTPTRQLGYGSQTSISNELGILILRALVEKGCSLCEPDLYYEQTPATCFVRRTDNDAFRAEFDRLLEEETRAARAVDMVIDNSATIDGCVFWFRGDFKPGAHIKAKAIPHIGRAGAHKHPVAIKLLAMIEERPSKLNDGVSRTWKAELSE